eukprot:3503075-Alexandrium_andersonii.AAC.1
MNACECCDIARRVRFPRRGARTMWAASRKPQQASTQAHTRARAIARPCARERDIRGQAARRD